jgi:hypothetical protein
VINKYNKWYCSIVEQAKNRIKRDGVLYEKHHIIPKSLGGDNSKENLVNLTCREHFICHRLLVKFTEGEQKYKMSWALHRMAYTEKYNITSRLYEIVRNDFVYSLIENHPSKKESWRKKVSNAVLLEWQNNYERKYKTSQKMKQMWKEGKLTAKIGSDNGMFGKDSWNKNKKFPGTGKSGKDNPAAKKYTILTPLGEQIMVECLKTFCDEKQLNYGCMKKVSQGKNKQHKGYTILGKEGPQ